MVSNQSKRVSLSPNTIYRELDGEAVLLNLDTEFYYGLDEVATTMFTLLTQADSVERAMAQLLDVYHVDREQLEADVHTFLSELLEQGLIQVEDAAVA